MPTNKEKLGTIRLYGKVDVQDGGDIVFYRSSDNIRFGPQIEEIFSMLRTWMSNEVMDIEIERYEE